MIIRTLVKCLILDVFRAEGKVFCKVGQIFEALVKFFYQKIKTAEEVSYRR